MQVSNDPNLDRMHNHRLDSGTAYHSHTEEDLRMEKKPTERGAASILIELENGTITIKHGTDGTVLHSLADAPEGTWRGMFAAFAALGIVGGAK
jgi:hypothetical protein